MAQISEFTLLQALLRSGGRCECHSEDHLHSGRCFSSIRKNKHYQGFEGLGGWELLLNDTAETISMDDVKVLCIDCYKQVSPADESI